ncbi:MAG TPA: hypothetical protein VFA26_17150, partial [Gemmataceae bacterium]|nr:hypothetical protein [Gemmataceae bacterium]
MASALAALALAGCLLSAAAGPECPPPPPASFLCCPAYCLDDVVRTPLRPYVPQEGDLLLFASDKRKWHVLLKLALTDEPWHAGIVVRLPDGHLAAFEAGPDDSLRLELRDLLPRLQGYCAAVWVRQRRTPLTCEQSARLTAFALANEGKRYASVRACGQLTPFRHRGPLSTYLVGKPQGDRRSYWCSELVLEACV